jgi:hypothetical protein
MFPPDYRLRSMQGADYSAIAEIGGRVYPADTPYKVAELAEHHRRFPEGQVVAEHVPTVTVARSESSPMGEPSIGVALTPRSPSRPKPWASTSTESRCPSQGAALAGMGSTHSMVR